MEPALASHAEALACIHAACFPPGARWGPDAMALQLAQPGAFGWIDAAGGLVLARVAADEAEILTIAVAQAARRRGLGRRLLAATITEAAKRGAASMVLEVAETNAPARALYAAYGFSQVGRRRRYYRDGDDALILRISLPAQITRATTR